MKIQFLKPLVVSSLILWGALSAATAMNDQQRGELDALTTKAKAVIAAGAHDFDGEMPGLVVRVQALFSPLFPGAALPEIAEARAQFYATASTIPDKAIGDRSYKKLLDWRYPGMIAGTDLFERICAWGAVKAAEEATQHLRRQVDELLAQQREEDDLARAIEASRIAPKSIEGQDPEILLALMASFGIEDPDTLLAHMVGQDLETQRATMASLGIEDPDTLLATMASLGQASLGQDGYASAAADGPTEFVTEFDVDENGELRYDGQGNPIERKVPKLTVMAAASAPAPIAAAAAAANPKVNQQLDNLRAEIAETFQTEMQRIVRSLNPINDSPSAMYNAFFVMAVNFMNRLATYHQ